MDDALYQAAPYAALALMAFGLGGRIGAWRALPRESFLALPTNRTYNRPNDHLAWPEAILFLPVRAYGFFVWLLTIAFHYSLAALIVGHLRLFIHPAPQWLLAWRTPTRIAAIVFFVSGLALLARRLAGLRRSPSGIARQSLRLGLILAVAATGLYVRYIDPVDLFVVKLYLLGVLEFDWQTPPGGLFLLHFIPGLMLIAYWPYSSLFHGPAILFSPLRRPPEAAPHPCRSSSEPWE